jgi:hypothetical protein
VATGRRRCDKENALGRNGSKDCCDINIAGVLRLRVTADRDASLRMTALVIRNAGLSTSRYALRSR